VKSRGEGKLSGRAKILHENKIRVVNEDMIFYSVLYDTGEREPGLNSIHVIFDTPMFTVVDPSKSIQERTCTRRHSKRQKVNLIKPASELSVERSRPANDIVAFTNPSSEPRVGAFKAATDAGNIIKSSRKLLKKEKPRAKNHIVRLGEHVTVKPRGPDRLCGRGIILYESHVRVVNEDLTFYTIQFDSGEVEAGLSTTLIIFDKPPVEAVKKAKKEIFCTSK